MQCCVFRRKYWPCRLFLDQVLQVTHQCKFTSSGCIHAAKKLTEWPKRQEKAGILIFDAIYVFSLLHCLFVLLLIYNVIGGLLDMLMGKILF